MEHGRVSKRRKVNESHSQCIFRCLSKYFPRRASPFQSLELVTAIPTELPLPLQRRCIEQILAKKSISEIEDFLKELVAHRRELARELEQLAKKENLEKSTFWVEITILSSREADSLETVLQRLRFLRTRIAQLDRFLYLLMGEKQP
jgi:DNA polymerase elongation subunit (family B)